MENKLCIEDVSKVFREKNGTVTALQNTSFCVAESEFVTILGPSGCGKSTILRIIAGLEEASSGKVLLDGRQILEPGKDRGMVFQPILCFPGDGEEILPLACMWPQVQNGSTGCSEVLYRTIGLKGFEKTFPRKLSGA